MKRRITICREGWYYVMVLVFIIGGAVLRQINLLILLAGLMTGPLFLNWRLVSATIRRVSVRRKLPDHAFAGEPILIDLIATNDRLRLSSWAVVLRDNISLENGSARKYSTKVEVLVPHIAAQDSSKTSYKSILNRRGRYRLGPLRISTRFPLGLLRASIVSDQPEELIVWPRIGRLTQRWARVIEAGPLGDRHSIHRQGLLESGEYYGVREWRPGDSQRWIHWRTSAKLGELAVRQFEQQRNRALAIVLDLWQPDDPAPKHLEHVELAVSFLATVIVDACRNSGKHLAVAMAGDANELDTGTSSDMLMRKLLDHLALIQPGNGNRLPAGLNDVLGDVNTGARLITISTRPANSVHLETHEMEPWRDAALRQMSWFDVSNNDHLGVLQFSDE